MLQPGEVVFIPFPFTDLATTTRRPVLLLRSMDGFGDFLAVAITSQSGHSDAIALRQDDFEEGTLPKASYVRTTKLYTLNKFAVAQRFGMLTQDALARVLSAICSALGCDHH